MLCRGGNGFLWPLLPASPRCPRERRDSVNIIVLGVESSSRVCAYHKAIDFPNQIHSSLPRNVPGQDGCDGWTGRGQDGCENKVWRIKGASIAKSELFYIAASMIGR